MCYNWGSLNTDWIFEGIVKFGAVNGIMTMLKMSPGVLEMYAQVFTSEIV